MPDILIAENIRGAAVDVLRSRFDVTFMPELWKDPAKLLECIGDYRALLVRNQTDVNAAVIAAGKKLVVIAVLHDRRSPRVSAAILHKKISSRARNGLPTPA